MMLSRNTGLASHPARERARRSARRLAEGGMVAPLAGPADLESLFTGAAPVPGPAAASGITPEEIQALFTGAPVARMPMAAARPVSALAASPESRPEKNGAGSSSGSTGQADGGASDAALEFAIGTPQWQQAVRAHQAQLVREGFGNLTQTQYQGGQEAWIPTLTKEQIDAHNDFVVKHGASAMPDWSSTTNLSRLSPNGHIAGPDGQFYTMRSDGLLRNEGGWGMGNDPDGGEGQLGQSWIGDDPIMGPAGSMPIGGEISTSYGFDPAADVRMRNMERAIKAGGADQLTGAPLNADDIAAYSLKPTDPKSPHAKALARALLGTLSDDERQQLRASQDMPGYSPESGDTRTMNADGSMTVTHSDGTQTNVANDGPGWTGLGSGTAAEIGSNLGKAALGVPGGVLGTIAGNAFQTYGPAGINEGLTATGYGPLGVGDVLQGSAYDFLSGPHGWLSFIPAALGIHSLDYLAGHNVAAGQLANGTLDNGQAWFSDDPNDAVRADPGYGDRHAAVTTSDLNGDSGRGGDDPGLAKGGTVFAGLLKGPGGPRDDKIPTRLPNGKPGPMVSDKEFVLNAKTTRRFGPEFFYALQNLAEQPTITAADIAALYRRGDKMGGGLPTVAAEPRVTADDIRALYSGLADGGTVDSESVRGRTSASGDFASAQAQIDLQDLRARAFDLPSPTPLESYLAWLRGP